MTYAFTQDVPIDAGFYRQVIEHSATSHRRG